MRIGVAQRRARLVRRHRLTEATLARDPVQVAESLVALHGTDPASVYLSVLARSRTPATDAIDRALYEDRTLVRLLGMRRTMFVVPLDVAPVVQSACADAIAAVQRRNLLRDLERADLAGDRGEWLTDVERSTVRALESRGAATAAELVRDEPRLRTSILMSAGKSYAATQNITSRVLFELAAHGRIVRGRPRGSWISSQYQWSPLATWLPGGLPALDPVAARAELVRRWLWTFGPAPLTDLCWWTGLGVTQVRAALATVDTVEVDLDGVPGLVLADDLDPEPESEPGAALLPALDPTPMGWRERGWFLGEHGPALFDRTGNIGPTVWWDGRIVGGWAQRKDGAIAVELLADVGADAVARIDAAAATLAAAVGEVRVTPRFRTPVERALTS